MKKHGYGCLMLAIALLTFSACSQSSGGGGDPEVYYKLSEVSADYKTLGKLISVVTLNDSVKTSLMTAYLTKMSGLSFGKSGLYLDSVTGSSIRVASLTYDDGSSVSDYVYLELHVYEPSSNTLVATDGVHSDKTFTEATCYGLSSVEVNIWKLSPEGVIIDSTEYDMDYYDPYNFNVVLEGYGNKRLVVNNNGVSRFVPDGTYTLVE